MGDTDLSKEIDGMLGSFLAGGGEETSTEISEEISAETAVDETSEEVSEETSEETTVEISDETSEEVSDETSSEEEEIEETAEQLRERLQKTIDFYEGRSQVPPSTVEVKSEVKPEVVSDIKSEPKEITLEPVTFVSSEDVADLSDDPEKLATILNTMLNKVRLDAVQQAIPLAQEQTMLSVPQVTAQYIKRHNAMKTLVDDFYTKNPDLKVVQRSVGMIANEVHAEHTDWTVQQVFDEAATRTRSALGLKAPVPGAQPKPGSVVNPNPDPAFAKPSQSRVRGAQKKLTGMAKEIDDLIS